MYTLYILSLLCAFVTFSECKYPPGPIYPHRPIYPIQPVYPDHCPGVCYIACPNGNIHDRNGCPICRCRPDECTLPRKIGPCRASIPRYYFNFVTKRCELFFWGGCQPNKNNFETIYDCQGYCGYAERRYPYPYVKRTY
uniref:BPTI/Kunitz domain-containing protein 1 n=1 Tax=Pinctada maxima TaxID=104660 RepID=KCP1_PINMA|nr:RecName: Full=BPTI/Kunitz domain-containing protein 1; AltName: Full=Prism serine protease inhibitor 1; Short=PSPI1; Flags: Precursor [Pinctada maxima]